MTCIHIIDDDKVSLELVKVLLEGLDFDIRCYGSALEFLENVTQATRGCVLTDMIMPGMSGIELQRELQALKIEIPIIIMSAHGDIRSARDAFKSGAVDFIEKPLSASELIEAVNEATRVTPDLPDSEIRLTDIAPKEPLTPKELKVFDYL
jgi:two-component system response regulator FixJ